MINKKNPNIINRDHLVGQLTYKYQEFMLATNLSEAESTETKLRMAFRLYDKDSSGDDHTSQQRKTLSV